jgi:hypothetical protein
MKPDYVGSAYKHANTEDEAVGRMTKSPKTSTKSRSIIDKQNNTLTIIEIEQL